MSEKATAGLRPGKLVDVLPSGQSLDMVVAKLRSLEKRHKGTPLVLGQRVSVMEIRVAGDPCGCHTCLAEDREVLAGWVSTIDLIKHDKDWHEFTTGWSGGLGFTGMVVCATCGNKRCPHANDHRNECTGSNEPGQPGSAYA